MIAVCTRTFLDAETGDVREAGETFNTTAERLAAINGTKYGQLAAEVPEKPSEPASAPKRATRRTRKAKG